MLSPDHSFVAMSEQDKRHVGLRAAEYLGYFSLGHRATKQSYLGHFIGGQQPLVVRNPADIDSVLAVAMTCHPFKIGDDVIGFDAINMVDDGVVVGVGDERKPNQTVNVDRVSLSIPVQINVLIAEFVDAGTENFPVYSSGFEPVTNAIKATYPTEIADLVEISEALECNGSPLFDDADIHVVGFLSGSDGLKIKDPLHASTFGGSAIMASGSDTYNRSIQCR